MKLPLKPHSCVASLFILLMLFSEACSTDHRTIPDNINDTYAQNNLPNLRFGSINIHSPQGTYDIIAWEKYTYSIHLFAENTGIKNVRVRAGIVDGRVCYDNTFSYISAAAPKRIEFTCTMPIGTHTMVIEADPENTITELNESDNRVTRTFIANLRIQAF